MLTLVKSEVIKVFKDLLQSQEKTTCIDVCNKLKENGYMAFHSDVSNMLAAIAKEEGIPFDSNGTYREYYLEPDGNNGLPPTPYYTTPAIVGAATKGPVCPPVTSVDDEDEIEKDTMQDGEVRFHMEEDGSYGSVRFKRLCKKCPSNIIITVEGIGTPKATASYAFTFKE